MSLPTDDRGVVLTCPSCGQDNRVRFETLDKTIRCGRCRTPLDHVASPVEVASVGRFEALVRSSPIPILVDFWAEWCGPCRMVAPELETVARSQAGRLIVAKVDTEALPELAGRFRVQSIPFLALFQQGRQIASEAGARPAREIEQFVSASLARASGQS